MRVDLQDQLLEALNKIDRPGTFCTSGRLPSILPGLEVAGAGPVGLPLTAKQQMAELKKHARQAPYGKGTQTLVDTDVRRVWEIDADQVALTNPEWAKLLQQAVGTTQTELGQERQKLEAHLYKLLLYEPGSFFLAHRDGEKLDRMVATLVIALPTFHKGGELVIRHDGQEMIVDFGPDSRFHTQFAAFYADCEHEIRPVTSGFRLALVYNLTLARSKRAITAPQLGEHIAELARLLESWKEESSSAPEGNDEKPPTKLAFLLDHKYSPAGLAFDALKGIDRARANALFAAARQSGFDASLALVTYWESGSAEPTGDYGYGYDDFDRDGYDDDDPDGVEMGEVFDDSLVAEHFRDADGNALAFGQVPLDDAEIVADMPLREGQPDKEDFEGYTGNAGMTLQRWYHRAAILLWPSASRFDVLCETGVHAAVGGLEQMVNQWRQAKKREQTGLKQQCLEFAGRIIANWPERPYAGNYFSDFDDADDVDDLDDDDFDDEADFHEDDEYEIEEGQDESDKAGRVKRSPTLLPLLEELGDPSLVTAWIRGVLAKDASTAPGKELGNICQQHGWTAFQDQLQNLFEQTTNETIERHAKLLEDLSLRKDTNADRRRLCARLAQQLMNAVERWDPRPAKRDWQARTVKCSELLPPLLQSFIALDEPELLDRLTTYVLDRPKEFDVTTVQVPALLGIAKWLKRQIKGPILPLRHWCKALIQELERRASHPPKKPADWQREPAIGCKCADCQVLSRFLKDPNAPMLRIPLAEGRRQHLHQIIEEQELDTTHVTERMGRPYTLVCTKNLASYERALQAHEVDLDQLANIYNINEWHDGLQGGESTTMTTGKKRKTRKS